MYRTVSLALVLALGISSGALAKQCRDDKGKFIKCPPAAAAPAGPAPAAASAPMKSNAGAPVCKTGKPCGNSCIAKNKVCHKTG
jgi:hypothetical protein